MQCHEKIVEFIPKEDVDHRIVVYFHKDPTTQTAEFELRVCSKMSVDLNFITDEPSVPPKFVAGYLTNALREFVALSELASVVEIRLASVSVDNAPDIFTN